MNAELASMRLLLLAINVVVLAHASTLVAQNVTATIRVEVRASGSLSKALRSWWLVPLIAQTIPDW